MLYLKTIKEMVFVSLSQKIGTYPTSALRGAGDLGIITTNLFTGNLDETGHQNYYLDYYYSNHPFLPLSEATWNQLSFV